MNYRRLIPIITPILVLILCEIFLQYPTFFYASLGLGSLLIVLAVKYLRAKPRHNWLLSMILPLVFFWSFAAYAAVIVGMFWLQLIFILIAIFLFVWLRDLYYFANYPLEPQWAGQLDNASLAGSFLAIFAFSAALLALPAFVSLPVWLMLLCLAIIFLLLLVNFKAFRTGSDWPKFSLLSLHVLVLTELSWVIVLLPLNFNILGLFLALFYYLDLAIIRLDNSGRLNKASLRPLLIAGLLLFIGLFLTTRWL